jgi:carboxypeptidase C (cathepsin A)
MSKNLLFIWLSLITIVLLFGKATAEDDGDWVDVFDLPIGFIAHSFYAGYLNITTSKAMYYNYFPSESNPSRDPLVVRISPGPGCSSLHHAYYSSGPFILMKNSTEFRVNPNNWNKKANLLFI